jgi:hypothetical protein
LVIVVPALSCSDRASGPAICFCRLDVRITKGRYGEAEMVFAGQTNE